MHYHTPPPKVKLCKCTILSHKHLALQPASYFVLELFSRHLVFLLLLAFLAGPSILILLFPFLLVFLSLLLGFAWFLFCFGVCTTFRFRPRFFFGFRTLSTVLGLATFDLCLGCLGRTCSLGTALGFGRLGAVCLWFLTGSSFSPTLFGLSGRFYSFRSLL